MNKRVVLVGIGGASSSGKTTLAKLLHRVSRDSVLLLQDDYFKNDKDIPMDEESGYENWDCPEAINFDAFTKEITHLKQIGSVSHSNDRYDSDTKDQVDLEFGNLIELQEQLSKVVNEQNLQLVFVDGFMLFHDPKLVELFDLRLFITASYETLKRRRAKRSGYQTQETFWVDPPDYFDKIVYASYASSHSYLFNDNNVENVINEQLAQKLHIHAFKNNDGTELQKVFEWGFKTLINYIETN